VHFVFCTLYFVLLYCDILLFYLTIQLLAASVFNKPRSLNCVPELEAAIREMCENLPAVHNVVQNVRGMFCVKVLYLRVSFDAQRKQLTRCDAFVRSHLWHSAVLAFLLLLLLLCIGLSRCIAITNLSIIVVFLEYLRQFLIDLNQTYRHSSAPKNTSPSIF